MSFTEQETAANDLIAGAAAIGTYIGKTQRQAEHLIEKREIPVFKLGGIWHMRKSRFAAHLEKLEATTAQAAA